MLLIKDFEPSFVSSLPETYSLLASANLVLHPRVQSVVLHGSRGLNRTSRPNSDIDLSLTLDTRSDVRGLQAVIPTTLDHWQAAVEPDLAVIFDIQKCGLKCFEQSTWDDAICRIGGMDCFGLYKIQKGYNGLVTNAGVQVRLMYPCIKIWQR